MPFLFFRKVRYTIRFQFSQFIERLVVYFELYLRPRVTLWRFRKNNIGIR